MIRIVEEAPEHRNAVAALHRDAFGGAAEANLVERLRGSHVAILSLVALDDGEVVGHVLFSTLEAEIDGRKVRAAALAPIAVQPARQRRGIGSCLVRSGLGTLKRRGVEAVIVLGHETYYPRFGFSAALARRLDAPFAGSAFMALELVPGALSGTRGAVRYPPAFGIV